MTGGAILIVGANGQLGTALKSKYTAARAVDVDELDISNLDAIGNFDWSGIEVIINAAAYTNVDGAETAEGQQLAKKVNSEAVANLATVAKTHNMTLVHISTDYVFDGKKAPHTEDEVVSPLGVYGQTKADGDQAATTVPKYYLLRTSWVIGAGKNFVKTMLELGKKGVNPKVVSDQVGRLTFTSELVRAIDFLLSNNCQYGIYNLSNDGPVVSWADISRKVFELAKLDIQVTSITTDEYFKDKPEAAPRPLNSELDLTKIKAAGFQPKDWQAELEEYIRKELQT